MKSRLGLVVVAIVVIALAVAYTTGFLGKILKQGEQVVFTVDFTATPTGNATFQFNATITGGIAPYSLYWDFGDGTFIRSQNPSHTFAAAGSYTVELLVVDGTGISRIATKTVVVL